MYPGLDHVLSCQIVGSYLYQLMLFSNEVLYTRWFKVTFWSPSWRSLNPLKGSLNHPKKVTLNHQAYKLVILLEGIIFTSILQQIPYSKVLAFSTTQLPNLIRLNTTLEKVTWKFEVVSHPQKETEQVFQPSIFQKFPVVNSLFVFAGGGYLIPYYNLLQVLCLYIIVFLPDPKSFANCTFLVSENAWDSFSSDSCRLGRNVARKGGIHGLEIPTHGWLPIVTWKNGWKSP